MAQVTLKGSPVHTEADIIQTGLVFPSFSALTGTDLSDITPDDFKGKKTILNIYPSIDTGTCAKSVQDLNGYVAADASLRVLCISMDLPFAIDRFFKANNIQHLTGASAFRSDFGTKTGLALADGPLKKLIARSLIVLDEQAKVMHFELVNEITVLPDYKAALKVLGK